MSVQDDSSNAPRIVAGVDGSPSSRAALRWAVRQAVLTGGTVEAVLAWQQTFVPGGYGGAPTAMISDVSYRDHSEKALAEIISEVVGAGNSGPMITGIDGAAIWSASR